jgi:hypothetical protein
MIIVLILSINVLQKKLKIRGGNMKVRVTVNRIGYSTRDIEVDVPVKDYCGRKLSEKRVRELAGELALAQSGNVSFSEHSAEYEIANVLVAKAD